MWEKMKMLVTSIFFFFHTVFRVVKNRACVVGGLTGWCFTALSTLFRSYHGDSSNCSYIYPGFHGEPVLGWGSKVPCPRTLPRRNAVGSLRLEVWSFGSRVLRFTSKPRRTASGCHTLKVDFVDPYLFEELTWYHIS